MYAIQIFQVLICLLASVSFALPHDQMVNNDLIRDVGVLYANSNFTGDPLFLVTHKKERGCETASIPNVNIGSVQVCVPSTCIFYQSKDCTMSDNADDYYFQGPVDADNLQMLPNIACESYECGPIEEMKYMIGNTAGAPVNSEGGHYGVVVRI